jgi:sec-independent protein translocase protein TatA
MVAMVAQKKGAERIGARAAAGCLYTGGKVWLDAVVLGIFQNLGAMEIFLILLIVLLLFGAKRLPDLSRSIGKSFKEFKKATSEAEEQFKSALDEPEKKTGAESAPKPEASHGSSQPAPTVPAGNGDGSADSPKDTTGSGEAASAAVPAEGEEDTRKPSGPAAS